MKKVFLSILITSTITTLWAEDLTRKIEASVFGADVHVHNDGRDHSTYGGNVGFGISSRATIVGEFSHTSFGGGDLVDFSGGVKYTLLRRGNVEPYALAAIAGNRSANDVGPGRGSSFGLHAGGGARFYVGKHWGIQPEIRWTRYFHDSYNTNIIRFSGGLFFQWGR
ncbi:MAG: hypothetical protein ABFD89_21845 [Bryobacteraceae bacterium]